MRNQLGLYSDFPNVEVEQTWGNLTGPACHKCHHLKENESAV